MRRATSLIALGVLAFAVPAQAEMEAIPTDEPAVELIAEFPEVVADILGDNGHIIGKATFRQGTIGVLANIEAKKLPAGTHGMHLHAVGTCEHMEHFKTASGHIDPDEKEHGFLNANGPEKGDLPNLIVHEDGTAAVELFLPQVDVKDLLDDDGTSLMIHEAADDHMTQPIGGSGARIACGVLQANQ